MEVEVASRHLLSLNVSLVSFAKDKWGRFTIQAPPCRVATIDGVATDLVVCLDRSKSMGRYWPLVVETLKKSVTKLTARDRLGIRTFAGQQHSKSVLKLTEMSSEGRAKALDAIEDIPEPSSGHTNLGAALEEGLDELMNQYLYNSERGLRLLLHTDGKPTVGTKWLPELLAICSEKLGKMGSSARIAVFAYGENHDISILNC